MRTVSADTILRGGWYALEQGGRLVHHAVTLFDREAWSTAIAVALLSREEVGKSQILFDLWMSSTSVTEEELHGRIENHEAKQRAGQATIRVGIGLEQPEPLNHGTGDPDYWPTMELLMRATRIALKRAPTQRHALRERALYVDLIDGTEDWARPVKISRGEAYSVLIDAGNDYSSHRNPAIPRTKFESGNRIPPTKFTQLSEALEAWVDKPELPQPIWPTA